MKGKLIGDILVVKKEPDNLEEIIKLPYVNKVVKLGPPLENHPETPASSRR